MKAFVAFSIGVFSGSLIGLVAADYQHSQEHEYIFDMRHFIANADYAYVVGTVTGEGVPYDNTRQITCYHDRMMCYSNSIDGISKDSCQLSRLESPSEFPVKTWTAAEIVATDADQTISCIKTTISLDLIGQVALWIEEPAAPNSARCAYGLKAPNRWTIEESRFWAPRKKKY